MFLMKKFLLTTAAFAVLAVPAMAADMAPAPMYKAPVPVIVPAWTGFYIGVNGGYGWANSTVTETPFQNFPPIAGIGFVVPGASLSQKLDGAMFGVHGGYNWQLGTWVVGVEGDFDGAGLNNSNQIVLKDPLGGSGGTATDGLMVHQDVQWLASIRARLGYTWGSSMVYATGGGAWESLRTNAMLSTDTSAGVFSQSGTVTSTTNRSGYAVGAGYEWMINHNWLARVEYLHYGFSGGSSVVLPVTCTVIAGGACGGTLSSSNTNIDSVRAALSYKF
jgi:outer membrane immunogenic protein